jgi:hypothetical protein
MLEPLPDVAPDIAVLITEDDTPVDNLPSEKQQRLLTEPTYGASFQPILCLAGPTRGGCI